MGVPQNQTAEQMYAAQNMLRQGGGGGSYSQTAVYSSPAMWQRAALMPGQQYPMMPMERGPAVQMFPGQMYTGQEVSKHGGSSMSFT